MAKPTPEQAKLKQVIDDLYKVVQATSDLTKEQLKVNKELLKVMALLEAGFIQNKDDANDLIEAVTDGLEIQDKHVIKMAKARKVEKTDTDNMIKRLKEIETLQEDEIHNAKDYFELISDRYDLIDDEYDVTKKLLSSHKEIVKIIQDNKKIYSAIGGDAVGLEQTLSKIISKKLDLNETFRLPVESLHQAEVLVQQVQDDITALINNVGGSMIDIPFNFNPLTGDLDKEVNKILENLDLEKLGRIKGLEDYFDKNRKMQNDLARDYAAKFSGLDIKVNVDTGDITDGIKQIKKGSVEYDKLIKKLDKLVIKTDAGTKLKQDLTEINQLVGMGASRTEDQEKRFNDLLEPLGMANKLLIKQIALQTNDLDIARQSVSKEANRQKVLMANLDIMKSTEKVMLKISDSFDYIAALLPRGVSEMLGFSEISSKLLVGHRKGIEDMVDSLSKGNSRAAALKDYYKAMTPALKSVLNPMTLLIAGGLLLFKYVEGVTDKLKDMAFQMQVSIQQSSKLLDLQLNILTSQENQFATLKDIEQIHTEFIGTSGKYYSAIKKGNESTVIQIAEMGRAFGYGASEAAKLHKTFSDLGASDELSLSLQGNLGLMSEMAGLSPQIIGKDLLDSSEIVFTYFAGLPNKAAQAAINVRRLGMSLKQAGSIAQKMLDLEGFMTDMYELNAMTAQGIDFGRAFEFGLMGDIENMTKEIMNNIGSTAEFNNMDYLTRMKIAKTLNMSVDDLAKSVKMHEQMAEFSGVERSMLEDNIDRMGDISKLSKDQIKQRLQDLQSTDRLSVAWDKIKGVLVKSLLPMVEAFADAIDAISPLIDILVGSLKVVGTIIKPIAMLIKGFLAPFKFIADIVTNIISGLFKFDDATNSINENMDKLSKVVQWIGTALGTWFIGKKLLSGIGLIKSQSVGLMGTIAGVGSSFTGMFSNGSKPATQEVENINKSIQTLDPTIQTISTKSKKATSDIISNVETSSKKAAGEIVKAGDTANTTLGKIKKNSSGLFSNLGASAGFGTVKSIATKTLAFLAVDQARLALGFGTTVKDGITENAAGIQNAMGGIFSMGGIMLSSYLDDAMTKVFEKKMEKRFEGGMKPIEGKAGTIFSKVGDMTGRMFDPIAEKSRNATNIMKNMFGNVFVKFQSSAKTAFSFVLNQTKQIGKLFNPVQQKIKSLFGSIMSQSTSIGTMFGKIFSPAQQKIKSLFDPIVSKLPSISGLFGKMFDSLPQKAKSVFANVADFAKKLLPKPFSILEQGLNKVQPTKVMNEVEDITKNISKTESTVSKTTTGKVIAPKISNPVVPDAPKLPEPSVPKSYKVPFKLPNPIIPKPPSMPDVSTPKSYKIPFNLPKPVVPDVPKLPELSTPKSYKVPYKIPEPQVPTTTRFDKFKTMFGNIFTGIVDVVKTAWKSLKGLLTEIVDFTVRMMSKLSKGIGQVINNLLSGIADGLNKFTTNSVKGAASLLIVSGALWVTSKALKNFAEVSWEDVGKGLITLGGLSLAGIMLGKMSGQMIQGAIAIGLLGASLIPAAYAFELFNKVEWESLGKAAAAIIGLGIIGNVLGPLLPTMAMGAIGIAALGASIIPLAYSLKMLNDVEWTSIAKGVVGLLAFGAVGTVLGAVSPMIVMGSIAIAGLGASLFILNGGIAATQAILSNLDVTNISVLTNELLKLTSVSSLELFGIASGISAISGALILFTTSNIFTKGISSLFGGSLIGEIKELAATTEPLMMLSDVLGGIIDKFTVLGQLVSNMDFSNLKDLDIDIDQKKKQEMVYTNEMKPIPQVSTPRPLPPPQESLAQNVSIQRIVEKSREIEVQKRNQIQEELEYNTDSLGGLSTKRLESLIMQMNQLLEASLGRPVVAVLDPNTVPTIQKKINGMNNR